MNVDRIREFCLSFPGATEQIQWGDDLLFKVGGKMFAVTPLVPAPVCLSFKASPENFTELTERPNIIPAPYLARAQWVALETLDALGAEELAGLLRESYELVLAKLPKKPAMVCHARHRSKKWKRGQDFEVQRKPAGKRWEENLHARKNRADFYAQNLKGIRVYLSSRYSSGTSSSGTSWVVTSSSSA